jgi:uncharacterized protein YdaU (DUF1376 family)
MSNRPWYPWYPADYESTAKHLSDDADLAYRRLLDLLWINAGRLPLKRNLSRTCAKLIRYDLRKWKRTWPELKPHFTQVDDYLVNERLLAEVTKMMERSEKARRSVERRWKRQNTSVSRLDDTSVSTGHANVSYDGITSHSHSHILTGTNERPDVDNPGNGRDIEPNWKAMESPNPNDTRAVGKLAKLLDMSVNKGESYLAFHVRLKDRLQDLQHESE